MLEARKGPKEEKGKERKERRARKEEKVKEMGYIGQMIHMHLKEREKMEEMATGRKGPVCVMKRLTQENARNQIVLMIMVRTR